MNSAILEWANLFVRWFHIIVGIGWIGTSFFFIYLDAHLTAAASGSKHSAGRIWLIHSGGYYEVEKLKYVPPAKIPELHWYKWEAYLTGLSGITLLFIVYYSRRQRLHGGSVRRQSIAIRSRRHRYHHLGRRIRGL